MALRLNNISSLPTRTAVEKSATTTSPSFDLFKQSQELPGLAWMWGIKARLNKASSVTKCQIPIKDTHCQGHHVTWSWGQVEKKEEKKKKKTYIFLFCVEVHDVHLMRL